MKALVCEMCGGRDIVKRGGVYVCEHCGMKYEPDDAKKLFVEVSGTVKIDNTVRVENLYELARRAKESGNYADAEKYYGQILLEEPSSWEASFYSTYCRAAHCVIAEIASSALLVTNSIFPSLGLIKQSNATMESQADCMTTLSLDTLRLSVLMYNNTVANRNSNAIEEHNQRVVAIANLCLRIAEALEHYRGTNESCQANYLQAHKNVVTVLSNYYASVSLPDNVKNKISYSEAIVKQHEQGYQGEKPTTGCQGCLSMFFVLFLLSCMLTMCSYAVT